MSRQQAMLRVFLVAGEESGDRLGAALMHALTAKTAGHVQFSGVGGDHMRAEGLESFFPLEPTAIIGFAGILSRLATYWRLIRGTAARAVAARPDVLVIIDSPEFTHRVAKIVRRKSPDIPIVDYVSPSVWAWRPWRARAMRRYVDHVMALLPFEPAAMAKLGGPPCTYVGHPLSERVGALRPNADEAERRETRPEVVLLMPGSRSGELKRMLPVFEKTAALLARSAPSVEFVLPAVPAHADRLAKAVAAWPVAVRIVSEPAAKDAALRIARLAVVKSGTSTLELAIAGVPMVAAYRIGHFEGLVALAAIDLSSVILANLVLGENIVPTFLQYNATPAKLAKAALDLLKDSPSRQRQIDAFARLDAIMEIGRAIPSERAADIVMAQAKRSSSIAG
jgi:lipid-A-disaccharide synthase